MYKSNCATVQVQSVAPRQDLFEEKQRWILRAARTFSECLRLIHCALYKGRDKAEETMKSDSEYKDTYRDVLLSLSLSLCPLTKLQIILWIAGVDPIVDAKGWENVKLEMTLVLMMTLVLTFYVKSIDRERRVSPQAAFCFTLMWCLCSLFTWERWRLCFSLCLSFLMNGDRMLGRGTVEAVDAKWSHFCTILHIVCAILHIFGPILYHLNWLFYNFGLD